MTNINKFEAHYNMQSHKASELESLLEDYLPNRYASTIVELAKEKGVTITAAAVRNIKSCQGSPNTFILSLLVELASQCKERDTKALELIDSAIK